MAAQSKIEADQGQDRVKFLAALEELKRMIDLPNSDRRLFRSQVSSVIKLANKIAPSAQEMTCPPPQMRDGTQLRAIQEIIQSRPDNNGSASPVLGEPYNTDEENVGRAQITQNVSLDPSCSSFKISELDLGIGLVDRIVLILDNPGFAGSIQVLDLPEIDWDKVQGDMESQTENHFSQVTYSNKAAAGWCKLIAKQDFKHMHLPTEFPVRTRPSLDEAINLFEMLAESPPSRKIGYLVGTPLSNNYLDMLDCGEQLRELEEMEGINTVYWHVGERLSGTAFHKEDVNLRSMNLVIAGWKIWLIIDTEDTERFEKYLRDVTGCKVEHDQWVRKLHLFIAPSALEAAGINFSILRTGPGDLTVTEPHQYHLVVNLTPCFAISINFLLPHETFADKKTLLDKNSTLAPLVDRFSNLEIVSRTRRKDEVEVVEETLDEGEETAEELEDADQQQPRDAVTRTRDKITDNVADNRQQSVDQQLAQEKRQDVSLDAFTQHGDDEANGSAVGQQSLTGNLSEEEDDDISEGSASVSVEEISAVDVQSVPNHCLKRKKIDEKSPRDKKATLPKVTQRLLGMEKSRLLAKDRHCRIPDCSEEAGDLPQIETLKLAAALRSSEAIAQVLRLAELCKKDFDLAKYCKIDRKVNANSSSVASLSSTIQACSAQADIGIVITRLAYYHFSKEITVAVPAGKSKASAALVKSLEEKGVKNSVYHRWKKKGKVLDKMCGGHRGLIPFIPIKEHRTFEIHNPATTYLNDMTVGRAMDFDLLDLNDEVAKVLCAIGTSLIDSFAYTDASVFRQMDLLQTLAEDSSMDRFLELYEEIGGQCGCEGREGGGKKQKTGKE